MCQLKSQNEQSKYLRCVFWDTETVKDKEGNHRPNAIAVSYEGKPGCFSNVCYFDAKMEHPMHGLVEKDAFYFKYYPDRMDDRMEEMFYKPPEGKRIKGLFAETVRARSKEGEGKSRGSDFLDTEAADVGDVESDSDSLDREEGEEELDIMALNEKLTERRIR